LAGFETGSQFGQQRTLDAGLAGEIIVSVLWGHQEAEPVGPTQAKAIHVSDPFHHLPHYVFSFATGAGLSVGVSIHGSPMGKPSHQTVDGIPRLLAVAAPTDQHRLGFG